MKVIVDIKGGLGNQLFCYAFGYALSKKKNAKLHIDTSMQDNKNVKGRNLELLNFNPKFDQRISYKYRNKFLDRKLGINRIRKLFKVGLFTKKYSERKQMIYDGKVFDINQNTYFDGFWQSEKYFKEYREELINMLVPNKTYTLEVSKVMKEVQEKESVALHVRRGDYVGLGWQLPMNYYDLALKKMNEEIGRDFEIFVFSDDIAFTKEYFSKYADIYKINYIQYESDNAVVEDLYVMSKCKHNIIANSSYSWWAAWLNQNRNKVVICPEIGMWNGDFYPEEWKKIHLVKEQII